MFKTFSIKSTLLKLECCWQGGALRRPNRHPQGMLTDLKTLQNSESVTVILNEEDDKGCVLCCHEDWRRAVNQGLLKAVHHNIISKAERCCWPHHSSLRHQAHREPSDTSGLPIRPSVELCWPHHCPDDICTEQLHKMTWHADLKTARKAVHFIKPSAADSKAIRRYPDCQEGRPHRHQIQAEHCWLNQPCHLEHSRQRWPNWAGQNRWDDSTSAFYLLPSFHKKNLMVFESPVL